MVTINQLGTFDVENYGDLLYPIVFRRILQRRHPQPSVRHYSFLPGDAPQEAGFKTDSLWSLFGSRQSGASRIVIGGGDILRMDWDLVAKHYSVIYRGYLSNLRRSLGTAGLVHYLLLKQLPVMEESGFYGSLFRSRWMNYAAAGPFLIDPDDLSNGSRVSYLSCGVPHEFAPAVRDKVNGIFDKARFIYLRDEQSRDKLRRSGVRRAIRVAPDLIVTLSDYFDHATEARKGREILSKLGVSRELPVLCFQSKPYPQFREEDIIQQLNYYRRSLSASLFSSQCS